MAFDAWNVGIDWDADDFVCMDAVAGDELNLIPTPVTLASVDFDALQTAAVTLETGETHYGLKYFDIQTGSGTEAGMTLGNDGATTDDIAISASTEYTVAFWIKGVSGYGGAPFRMRVLDQGGNTIATSGQFLATADWVQKKMTFTTGVGDSYIEVEVYKDNLATDMNYLVSGFMVVAGDTAPAGFNAGHATNLFDNITNDILDMRYKLGGRAWKRIADEASCKLKVQNISGKYSPENSSGDLFGYLVPELKVIVEHDEIRRWTGKTWRFKPNVYKFKNLHADLTFVDRKRFLDEYKIAPTLFQSATYDAVLKNILDRAGVTYDENYLDVGVKLFDYIGDNFQQQFTTELPAYEIMSKLLEAERGFLFHNEYGVYEGWNRYHLFNDSTPDYTFNDTGKNVGYVPPGESEFYNRIEVEFMPRTVSSLATDILWEIGESITLQPDEELPIIALFTDSNNFPVGASDVAEPSGSDFIVSDGSVTLSGFSAYGQQAEFTLTNDSSTVTATITTIRVRGRTIASNTPSIVVAEDTSSQATYGIRTLKLQLHLINSPSEAKVIADYELSIKSVLVGEADYIELENANDGTGNATQIAVDLGDLVRVINFKTGHDRKYHVVGMEHVVDDKNTHLTKLHLQPAPTATFFTLDTSALDGSDILAP